jgi:transposase
MKEKLSLSETERTEAQRFVRQGKANARSLTRAWVLLKLADGWDEAKIAETFAISHATITNVTQRFAEGGLDLVLHDRVQQRRRQALTGQQAAHLIALTCSPAPDGHDHWTVRLLKGKAVELGFVKSISPNTIHQLLKKTNSSPGNTNTGACPRSAGSL